MRNLNFTQKLAWITLLLVCVSLLFLFWYKKNYPTEITLSNEVNSHSLDRKLLLATQGSPFKDAVTAGVLDYYSSSPIVVEVIDHKALAAADAAAFDAILIIHRWEAGAPSERVELFIDQNLGWKNKMVILTTSWNGLEKMDKVDAITGASVVDDAPIFTDKITDRLDRLLKYKI